MNTKSLDFILNGVGQGDVATRLLNCNFNTNTLRPWLGNDGRSYITLVENGVPKAYPVTNANASLRKDDWIHLDRAIIRAARPQLKLVADIRGAGLTLNIPNGMGTTVLQTERQTDVGDATVSMDGVREGERDRPEYDLTNLPLPIIHKDFSFTARQIAASRASGTPLDTTMAELCGRKVGEIAEKFAIGSYPEFKFAGGVIYGLTNFNMRQTHEITAPTDTDWTPETLIEELLAMRQKAEDAFQNGPYNVYFGKPWGQYLDRDYIPEGGNNANQTLRKRVQAIEGFTKISTLDFLSGFQIVLVQMTSDVVRQVIGMDLTTVQWPSLGGLTMNFKVMAILVPQVRCDIAGNCGIVHGNVA